MHPCLQRAYEIGVHAAHAQFEKVAKGEVITPLLGSLGAIPGIGGLPAGVAGGLTAERGDRLAAGLGAGLGSQLGGIGGLVGGGVLGAGAGYGVHRLAKALGSDIDPEKAMLIGSILGAGTGALGGGAYGAHKGRGLVTKESSTKTAEGAGPVSALGALPLVGPTAAGLASRAYSPPGEEDIIAPMTASRSLKGQLIGGLGGAALGAGGLALAKQLGLDTDVQPSTAALVGGLLGTGVGGAIGAHSGHQRGHDFVNALDESIASRDQDVLRNTLDRYGYRIAPAY